MPTKLKNGETILFIGDSITDCGRRTSDRPLGCGYVKMFSDLVAIRDPQKKISVINKGISGDSVVGLQSRWTDDVLRHKPDWLSVKIGINDLHRVLRNTDPIPPDMFEAAYDDILTRTRRNLPSCKILLIDPFFISREKAQTSFRKGVLDLIPEYINVVHKMSKIHGAGLIETHKMFQNLLKYHEPELFCPEPVHPNSTGHMAIAEAVYEALS